jgi:hypothetical protein
VQLTCFEADAHPVVGALMEIDVEALTKLAELQKLVKG